MILDQILSSITKAAVFLVKCIIEYLSTILIDHLADIKKPTNYETTIFDFSSIQVRSSLLLFLSYVWMVVYDSRDSHIIFIFFLHAF